MSVSIEIFNLKKAYNEVTVVDDINFKINKGELIALLGPNGAGKTTTIKMLGGILKPTSGYAQILGYDIRTEAIKIKERLGVLTEHYSVYENLNARENLELFAELYNVQNPKEKINDILKLFQLDNNKNDVKTFSKGMKKKLALARSIFHNPEIIFLDEPSSDLDPKSANELRNHLKVLVRKNELSGIICTHNIYDAVELCDRFIIMKNGKLLLDGTKDDLLKAVNAGFYLNIKYTNRKELVQFINIQNWVSIVEENNKENTFKLMVDNNKRINDLMNRFADIQLLSFGENTNQIERAYIELIGRENNENQN